MPDERAHVEGDDPSSMRVKIERLNATTKRYTYEEGVMADELFDRQGYALRWYPKRGVIVHRTREEWSTHTGVTLTVWLRARGMTLAMWREVE